MGDFWDNINKIYIVAATTSSVILVGKLINDTVCSGGIRRDKIGRSATIKDGKVVNLDWKKRN